MNMSDSLAFFMYTSDAASFYDIGNIISFLPRMDIQFIYLILIR
jgi:hypothetical protein